LTAESIVAANTSLIRLPTEDRHESALSEGVCVFLGLGSVMGVSMDPEKIGVDE